MINQILINFGIFSLSILIYHFFYYLIWKIIYKEFPKSKKDLEIISLKEQLSSLKETNQELKEENQEITNLIIRRIKWENLKFQWKAT